MDEKFDLVVIGGGPGGYVAAARALQLGLKTAVIEEREMGGTCLNRGCIPTKALLHSAEVYQTVKSCDAYGISAENAAFDYSKIAARRDKVVKQLRSGVEMLVKGRKGVIYSGKAYLKDKNTIEVTGEKPCVLHADKIIIATGSMPSIPPIPGIDGEKVLDSDAVLAMATCPESIVIIGGGVIGVEFASLYTALGKQVTILEMMENILPGTDTEISGLLRKSLEKKGIKIFTGARVTGIENGAKGVCAFEYQGKKLTVEGDIVIAAIGRKPNSKGLGLENLGIETDRGFIRTDDHMETPIKGVYAIGDVTGRVLLAHAASAQGLVAAANAAGQEKKISGAVPGCIYTSPEIATVGLSEADAVKGGHSVRIGRFAVSMNGKSKIAGETEGLAKIVTDEKTGEILGAHIMAPRATDMIAELCTAMKLESTIEELADVIHPHPTVSEIIMEAANDALGQCVNKPE
ncbi:MAG: dihydrolipoyl dehydrogenase [Clostridia bacterium]|nr:dihydrolipoyl dehydrogenase [Clostridia bacterium]